MAFTSQSGGNSVYMIRNGAYRGIRFSKVISYGNACDLEASDFLDYLAHDPETRLITAYIEGVGDGRRFLKALKEASRAKPVIVLKGGHTEAGAASAASHTGSLAGVDAIWDGLCRQAGAIRVYSMEEMMDLVVTFLYMSPPQGRNVGVIGLGGGASVQAADDCEGAGLRVPPLPSDIVNKLEKLCSPAGSILRNPVDTQSIFVGRKEFGEAITTVANWPGIDVLILHIGVGITPFSPDGLEVMEPCLETFIEYGRKVKKPVAISLHSPATPGAWQAIFEAQRRCFEAGLPVYPSVAQAAMAISRYLKYHSSRGHPTGRAT